MEPILRELHPQVVTEEEKAFGITQKATTGILLRNWLTYLLRHCILQTERAAYHITKKNNLTRLAKTKFRNALGMEIHIKAMRYKKEGKTDFFDKMITYGEVLCKKRQKGGYEIREIFP